VIVTSVPQYARVARTATMTLRNTEFILAERALGAGTGRILRHHIMPNVIGPLLILAGLWERSPSARGESRESFTLVTTGPNRLLTKIGHHRAPVVLDADQWSTWLSGDETAAESVIRPPADGALTAEPVTRRVNNPGYQGDDLRPVCRA